MQLQPQDFQEALEGTTCDVCVSCRTWFELTELRLCSPVVSAGSVSQPSPTGALSVQSAVFAPPAHSHLQPELCPCSLRCLHLRLTAISNRSSVRAVCGVCTSGSQPSPTGALSVQSAVFAPPAHSHLQPELCPCSLRCLHLRLTAISNRSSVRAVCGVCTSGSQPSPTGALSVQSAVYAPPAHSHLQPELCPCSLRCTLCYDWLMTGGPDDVSELPDLVRAHRGSLYSQ